VAEDAADYYYSTMSLVVGSNGLILPRALLTLIFSTDSFYGRERLSDSLESRRCHRRRTMFRRDLIEGDRRRMVMDAPLDKSCADHRLHTLTTALR
jgi:hypothetical protein